MAGKTATMGTPGRYDEQCERVSRETEAELVILLVAGGNKGGPGFSVSSKRYLSGVDVAAILREFADMIDGKPPDGLRVSTKD